MYRPTPIPFSPTDGAVARPVLFENMDLQRFEPGHLLVSLSCVQGIRRSGGRIVRKGRGCCARFVAVPRGLMFHLETSFQKRASPRYLQSRLLTQSHERYRPCSTCAGFESYGVLHISAWPHSGPQLPSIRHISVS